MRADGETKRITLSVAGKLSLGGHRIGRDSTPSQIGVYADKHNQYIQENDNPDRQLSSQQPGHFHLHKYRMKSAHRNYRFHT